MGNDKLKFLGRRNICDEKSRDAAILKLRELAAAGDLQAIKLLLEYSDGPPKPR